jgi:hypothetical protein
VNKAFTHAARGARRKLANALRAIAHSAEASGRRRASATKFDRTTALRVRRRDRTIRFAAQGFFVINANLALRN